MLTGKEGHQTLRRHVGIGSPHTALGSQHLPVPAHLAWGLWRIEYGSI